jgi:hypothetical protein
MNSSVASETSEKNLVSAVRDPEHLLEVLEVYCDLVFPPGTRFSRPEF